MPTIYQWILENWQLIIPFGVLLFILSITGTITQTLRTAKKGLKEVITPLGFFVFLAMAYLAYRIYLSIMETL